MLLQSLAVVTLDVLDDGNTSLSNVRKSTAPITGSKLALKPAADVLAATTAHRLLGKGENTWTHNTHTYEESTTRNIWETLVAGEGLEPPTRGL